MKLFNGDDQMFKSILKNSKNYFEYGCGASTKWVVKNTNAKISCVDSSVEWINSIEDYPRLKKIYIDIGKIGKWGYPLTLDKQQNFPLYSNAISKEEDNIDVVLIDGRFRVACFLNTLKYVNEGTSIIFDDYANRPYYHIVEKIITPQKYNGRQALFVVSPNIDQSKIDCLLSLFEMDQR
jgi:hypothetical protein